MNNLTPKEQKLVELFRCLTPEAQQIVMDTLRLVHAAEAALDDFPRN